MHQKCTCLPRRQVQEQPSSEQVVAVPVIPSRVELILQLPFPSAEIPERQSHMTLTLIRSIVHSDDHVFSLRSMPREDHKAIVRPISIPAGRTLQELPFAIANSRLTKHCQQAVVKLPEVLIDRLLRASNQVRRNSLSAAFELPLVEETQAGGQKREDRSSLMNFRGGTTGTQIYT